jgi:hypothetical protein
MNWRFAHTARQQVHPGGNRLGIYGWEYAASRGNSMAPTVHNTYYLSSSPSS